MHSIMIFSIHPFQLYIDNHHVKIAFRLTTCLQNTEDITFQRIVMLSEAFGRDSTVAFQPDDYHFDSEVK